MPENFQFESLAKTSTLGHMQAVSDDGNVVVYRTEEYFYVHYFDGSTIETTKFQVKLYMSEVNQKYAEEANAQVDVLTRIWEKHIVVYVVSYTRKQIGKATISLENKDDMQYEQLELSNKILDMTLHPKQDCLIALDFNSLNFIFRGNDQPHFTVLLDSSVSVESGKLKTILEYDNIYMYLLIIRNDSSHQYLEILKVKEESFGQEYNVLGQKTDQNEQSYNELEVFAYDKAQKMFGIVRDYINPSSTFRQYKQIFLSDDLNFLTLETNIASHIFHNFLSETHMVCGKFDNFIGADTYHLTEICLASYSIVEGSIKIDRQNFSCKQGNFDRVAVWNAADSEYILTQVDYNLTISENTFADQLPYSLKVNTFSVKKNGYLIADNFGQLQYLKLSTPIKTTDEVEEENVQTGFIIGISILSVLFVVLLVILIWVCLKLKKINKKNESQGLTRKGSRQNLRKQGQAEYDINPFMSEQVVSSPNIKKKNKDKKRKEEQNQYPTAQEIKR